MRLLLVLAVAALCAALAALSSAFVEPRYVATAQLVAQAGTPDDPAAERAAADQVYARTFAELLDSPTVAELVASRLSYPLSAEEAVQRTSFTAIDGTAVVEVVASGPDPRRAAALATTWATVAAEGGAETVGVRNASLTLASPAVRPSTPESPRPLLYSGFGAAGGGLVATVALLLSGQGARVKQPRVEQPGVERPRVQTARVEQPRVQTARVAQPPVQTARVQQPAAEQPRVQKAPATKAPATKAPTEPSRVQKAPATKAPATKAPATKAPATKAPATEARATAPTAAADRPSRTGRLAVLVQSRRTWLTTSAAFAAAATAVVLAQVPVVAGPLAVRLAVGLAAGAVAGAVLALVALVVYDRFRGLVLLIPDAVRATGADVVVETTEPRRLRAATGLDMRFRDLEPYRALHGALTGRPDVQVVLVAGQNQGARAALRSIDVAVAGANAGVRTILVGTHLQAQRRSIHEILSREAMLDENGIEAELTPTDRPRLRVLPLDWPNARDRRGRDALESRRLPLLVDRLRASADFVVLSSPPLSEPEVPLRLAAVAHAAILVVVAGSSTAADCRRAAERLTRAGSQVIGVVLVHRGRARQGLSTWTRPRPAGPAGPVPPGDRPAGDEAHDARELASALRHASAGSGRAGATPAAGPTAQ